MRDATIKHEWKRDMELYTDNGSAAVSPQGNAPKVLAQKPVRKKKWWPWIAGGAVLVAAAAIALVLCLTPAASDAAEYPASPVLFVDGGEVYLAAGGEAILLDGASIIKNYYEEDVVNAEMTDDGRWLYYMANVDGTTDDGDLMRIALWDVAAEPELVAEGVNAAKISEDGSRVLYITNCERLEGDIYLCTPGGESERLDKGVYLYDFGLSPDGTYAYYALADGVFTEELVLWTDGKSEKVADLEDEMLLWVQCDNDGRLAYGLYNDGDSEAYLFDGEDTERVRDVRIVLAAFSGADEFLYLNNDSELCYCVKGETEQIAGDDAWPRFPNYTGAQYGLDTRFLFSDDDTLYEIRIPGEADEVCEADGVFSLDPDFRYVAYEQEGTLYLTRKTAAGWQDEGQVCDNPFKLWFTKEALYYIAMEHENDEAGTLWRMTLSSGEQEELLSNAGSVVHVRGEQYVLTEDGAVYHITAAGEPECIAEGATALYGAQNGVYVSDEEGLLYCGRDGATERVPRGGTVIDIYGAL